MPLERNLTDVDQHCPDCGDQLAAGPHDQLWCRSCGEQKPPQND